MAMTFIVSLTTGFQDASNSPRAKRMYAWAEANNSGKPESLKEFMMQHYVAMDEEKFKKQFDYLAGIQKEFGKMTIEGLGRAGQTMAHAMLKPSAGGDMLKLQFEFDPNNEWKIISISEVF